MMTMTVRKIVIKTTLMIVVDSNDGDDDEDDSDGYGDDYNDAYDVIVDYEDEDGDELKSLEA